MRLHTTVQNSGDKLPNGTCCFMRATAWLYHNGQLTAETYMNHYCWIRKFTARTSGRIMDGSTLLLEVISGEYTTAGEYRAH